MKTIAHSLLILCPELCIRIFVSSKSIRLSIDLFDNARVVAPLAYLYCSSWNMYTKKCNVWRKDNTAA